MRTVRTGRTPQELVEVGQPTHCSECGHAFEPPRYTTTWRQCSCTDGETGHRVWICLYGSCRGATTVPPCARDLPNPLTGHGDDGPAVALGDGQRAPRPEEPSAMRNSSADVAMLGSLPRRWLYSWARARP